MNQQAKCLKVQSLLKELGKYATGKVVFQDASDPQNITEQIIINDCIFKPTIPGIAIAVRPTRSEDPKKKVVGLNFDPENKKDVWFTQDLLKAAKDGTLSYKGVLRRARVVPIEEQDYAKYLESAELENRPSGYDYGCRCMAETLLVVRINRLKFQGSLQLRGVLPFEHEQVCCRFGFFCRTHTAALLRMDIEIRKQIGVLELLEGIQYIILEYLFILRSGC